jgi:hypothetical protein
MLAIFKLGGAMNERTVKYLELMKDYLDRRVKVEEFQATFFTWFKDEEPFGEPVFQVLDTLFGDLDAFTSDPELLESSPDYYVNEAALRSKVEEAAFKLKEMDRNFEAAPVLKDADVEKSVPSTWRNTISGIVEAFKEGDFTLTRRIAGVRPVSEKDAAGIVHNILDHGAQLASLPDETWQTSVCRWWGTFWQVCVDLYTVEEGASDLILHLRVYEEDSIYVFAVIDVDVKKTLFFDVTSAPSLSAGLHSGLSGYAVELPKVGPPRAMWLRLCDGRTLWVGVDMHDLSGWEEIGTLIFEVVSAEDAPKMVNLPATWSDVREVQTLVYKSHECQAECGFVLSTSSGEQLVVVPGADVYSLAIKAPFHQLPFRPENALTAYSREAF